MSIFRCEQCGCVENTATSRYWFRDDDPKNPEKKALCSGCHPATKKWHGIFPQEPATGYLIGNDGFLYSKEERDSGGLDWRMKHQGFKIVGECP